MGKKKRGHGEGSIYQRKDGMWVAQVTISYDPLTKKIKRKAVYGKSKKEVQEKMRDVIHQNNVGVKLDKNNMTLENWIDKWMELHLKHSIEDSTRENYEIVIETHIKPFLGHLKLKDLSSDHVQRFINFKLENKEKGGGGYSNRYVNYMVTILSKALNQAVKDKLIIANVVSTASRPKKKKFKFSTLTLDEMNCLLDVAKEHRLYAAFLLESRTGMRRGELGGLMWTDINFTFGTLTVNRSLARTEQGLVFQPPKTKKSARTIALPKTVLEELKLWKEKQQQEKIKLGSDYQDMGLVFCSPFGTPMEPRSWNRILDRFLKKAGLKKVRFHDLRHSVATMLLEKKVHPKVVQELFGHEEISTTLDIYSHVALFLIENATNGLDEDYNLNSEKKESLSEEKATKKD